MSNGYDIKSINALSGDPGFLAALQTYNPNFRETQQVAPADATYVQKPQVVQSQQTQALPKADYSEEDFNALAWIGGTVGASALLGGLDIAFCKGKHLKKIGNFFKGKAGKATDAAEAVTGGVKKKEPLANIKVMMKGNEPVYYIPGRTTTAKTPAEIQNLINNDSELKKLTGLRFRTGETNINSGTFTLKDGGDANTIIFKGDKIEDIINSAGTSIKDKFLENGKIRSDLKDVSDNAFARRIEEHIEKIKQGDRDIIFGKDTNLRDFTYTTKIGDNTANITRKQISTLGAPSDNVTINELTTLKEFNLKNAEDKEAVYAYVRTAREKGNNVDSIVGKDFLNKKNRKLPDGYKVHEFTLTDHGTVIKIVDGKVEGITVGGKYFNKDTDKCKAYLEIDNRSATIDKMIERALKDNAIPDGATIIAA